MKAFVLQTPASSANLGPGFDALGLAVNLYNQFHFKLQDDNQSFSFAFKNTDIVSKDYDYSPKNNLLLKAYLYACGIKDLKPVGLDVVCDNQIPDSSGLGSSTTAILAGIAAAFVIEGNQLDESTKKQILKIAFHFETHPDNLTPCLYGGFCIGVMNEQKNQVDLARHELNHANLKAIVVMPQNQRTSTTKSRALLSQQLTLEQAIFNLSRSALLTSSLISGNFSKLKVAMQDAIHQDTRLTESGEKENFAALYNLLKDNPNFYGMSMSGSGPSVLILGSHQLEIKHLVNQTYPKGVYFFDLGFDNQGVRLL